MVEEAQKTISLYTQPLHTFDDSKIDREYFTDEVKKQYWMARYKTL